MGLRHEIRYDRWSRWLLGLLGLGPRFSRIVVDQDDLEVVMGWAFRARIPLAAIADASLDDRRVISLGVHGWRGRWLVNGSWHGLVRIDIDPPAASRVLGLPGKLRQLVVSVEDPEALVARLS